MTEKLIETAVLQILDVWCENPFKSLESLARDLAHPSHNEGVYATDRMCANKNRKESSVPQGSLINVSKRGILL